jgi:hypothetical protein
MCGHDAAEGVGRILYTRNITFVNLARAAGKKEEGGGERER